METRAHYVWIGGIVLSAVAAGFLFVIWLSQSQREYDEYDVVFTERVSGLSVGAQVRFNGIQKGEVDTLTIDPDDPSIVVARIRVGKDTPVKVDTLAELEPVGFTGLLIVQLVGGSANEPLLKDVAEEKVPVIDAGESTIGQFLEGSGDVLAQALRLLSDKNIQSVSGFLSNVETLTGAFADNEDDIVATLQNVNALTADLAKVTAKLDAAASGLQALLEEDAPATMKELNALLGESRSLVEDLRGVTAENRDSLKIFTDQGLGQVAPALAEARRLMRTLDYMMREIDRDPKAYFLGETAPEYGPENGNESE